MNYVIRRGRRIEIETLDTGVPSTKIRRRRPDAFAVVPLQWATKASAATNSRKTMVLVWLIYRAWQTKSSTFAVPNKALSDYGVTPKVKRLVSRRLEAAGLITVERCPGKSPIVTLLGLGPE